MSDWQIVLLVFAGMFAFVQLTHVTYGVKHGTSVAFGWGWIATILLIIALVVL